MSGITPYYRADGNVADRCRTAVAEIGAQVDRLRVHLGRLDAGHLRISPVRLEALLVGFDIYARMLDDALNDIVTDLLKAVPADAGEAQRLDVELAGGDSQ